MVYSRQTHFDFLESELKAQTNAFKKKLDTEAQYLLLKRGELFVAQFLTFKDGEMILKFSNNRSLPRKRDFLYCMLLPKELRDYRNWGVKTYGDLIKKKAYHTEIVCIWHAKSEDDGYSIAGFRGVDIDFSKILKEANGIILVLGPNKPPYEYIMNLQEIANSRRTDFCSVLDEDYKPNHREAYLLDSKDSVAGYLMAQINLHPALILQGPPGTGKSHMIAELCRDLCARDYSVLVTALTNRALIEIAEKPAVRELLEDGKILKTNLSYDEHHELPKLEKANDIIPFKGRIMLSTYYITSGAVKSSPLLFDYVIMDEASQALLAMFEVATRLGKHNFWIGDVKQLPPVVEISEDKIVKRGYQQLVDGLNTLTECSSTPIYQLTETYRLSPRATEFTKIFYQGHYYARNQMGGFGLNEAAYINYLHWGGGPTLIKTDLPVGETAPAAALILASMIVADLFEANKGIHVAVLSCMVETVKQLQRAIIQTAGNRENLLVETVARVQGLTTDVAIFVIPQTVVHRSMETRLFNVATSRAKGYTIIITDKDIMQYRMSKEVRKYMKKLDEEFSFYLPFDKQKKMITVKE